MSRRFTIASSVLSFTLAACGGPSDTSVGPEPTTRLLAGSTVVNAFPKDRSEYTITKAAAGYTVTDIVTGTATALPEIASIVFRDMTVNTAIAENARRIPADRVTSVIELYIAYFNRLPDADGLNYWIDQITAGHTLDQIGQSFYDAAIQYSTVTGYSAEMNNAQFVTKIYHNVLGRAPDAEGLKYWAGALSSGAEPRGTLVRTILASAHTFKGDPTYGYVADLLDNKLDAAYYFAVRQGLNYNSAADSITKTMGLAALVTPLGSGSAIGQIGVPSTAIHGFAAPMYISGVQCEATETVDGLTICMSHATLDGKPFAYNFSQSGAAIDLDSDGRHDLILNNNFNTQKTTPTPVNFFRGAGNGRDFYAYTPPINGGEASAQFTRTILVSDFNNDGKVDFYLGDAAEFSSSPTGFPFNGAMQYAYLTTGTGQYQKTELGIGSKTVHGAGIGSPTTDGFSLLLNTPWNDDFRVTNILNTVKFSGLQSQPTKYTGAEITNGSYTAAIDANGDGVKDIVMLTYTNVPITVYLNDGHGNFSKSATISHFTSEFQQIENVAVADFNGDGHDDFVVQYIDRTDKAVAENNLRSTMRVYINDGKGSFTDKTAQWLGNNYQAYDGGYFDFYAVDVDGNRKKDIVFTTQARSQPAPGSTVDASLVLLKNTGSAFAPVRFSSLQWKETFLASQQWMPGSVVIVQENGRPVVLFSKNGVVQSLRFQS